DEVRVALSAIFHYFGRTEPRPDQLEAFTHFLPTERMLATWDGEHIVGGAGVFPMMLTVPGARVRAAGVSVVGVLPPPRRRGVLSAMMRAQLDDCRRRGEALAALWASGGVVYGRFRCWVGSATAGSAWRRGRRACWRGPPGGGRRARWPILNGSAAAAIFAASSSKPTTPP